MTQKMRVLFLPCFTDSTDQVHYLKSRSDSVDLTAGEHMTLHFPVLSVMCYASDGLKEKNHNDLNSIFICYQLVSLQLG